MGVQGGEVQVGQRLGRDVPAPHEHRVLVVKPIVLRKRLVKQDAPGGRVLDRRMSPKKGCVWDLFDELVYFTRVFPHRNLTLETPLVEIEEWRSHDQFWMFLVCLLLQ